LASSVVAVFRGRRCAVHLPDPETYFRLRTSRNRQLVTDDEQRCFRDGAVAVGGLSVGFSILHNLVLGGGPRHVRIADFDRLSVPNLNRLAHSVTEIGVRKTRLAARRVYELEVVVSAIRSCVSAGECQSGSNAASSESECRPEGISAGDVAVARRAPEGAGADLGVRPRSRGGHLRRPVRALTAAFPKRPAAAVEAVTAAAGVRALPTRPDSHSARASTALTRVASRVGTTVATTVSSVVAATTMSTGIHGTAGATTVGAANDGGSDAANGSQDAPSAYDFSFEPATFDLAPGETATLRVRGSSELASISLTLAVEPLPDAGVPASAVTLGASSVSLATGEATISVQAAANAPQQRFRVIATAGSVTHEALGRITGKSGELDLFFGDGEGYFEIAPDGDCAANAVAVQPDGRFVVAGSARSAGALLVARFTPEGALDPSFGPNGSGFVTLAQALGPRIELMPDGAVAIAANAFNSVKLFRVDASGVPDPAWGGANGIGTDLGSGNFQRGALGRLGADLYVGGSTSSSSAAVKRYLPDGGLDTSLATGGTATVSLPPQTGTSPRIEGPAVEPSGTYWVAGQYSSPAGPPYERSFVRRFRSSGSDDGVDVSGTYQGAATDLVVQGGKAVVGAFDYPGGNYSMHAFRVTNDIDATFGTSGKALVAGPPGGFATSMAIDSSSRIYVVNGAYTVTTFEVFRLTPNGDRDTSFGPLANGLVRLPTGRAYGAAITGRQLLVVGVNDANDQRRMRIARIWL